MKDNLIDNAYSISVEVKSRSEDADKPVRTTYVRLVAPSPTLTNNQIVVLIRLFFLQLFRLLRLQFIII